MAGRNSWRDKREERFMPAHNRKAGMTKFWKHLAHRKYRRAGNRYNREMVEERDIK